MWVRRLFLAVVTGIGNDSDTSANFTEFSHSWLDDKVDEANLARGNIRGFPVHQHRYLHVHTALEVSLSEKFPKNKVCPLLAYIPVTARVCNVGNMQCLPKKKDLAIGAQVLLNLMKLVIALPLVNIDLISELPEHIQVRVMISHVCSEDHLDDDLSYLTVIGPIKGFKDVQVFVSEKQEGLSHMMVLKN
jgi:hypothetical protein